LISSGVGADQPATITVRGALLRVCEYDRWPIKIERWYPRHEVTDPDAMLWHIEVRYKGMPVLVMDWSEEKVRQKTYESGPWERMF
jgi:hypothetical protein